MDINRALASMGVGEAVPDQLVNAAITARQEKPKAVETKKQKEAREAREKEEKKRKKAAAMILAASGGGDKPSKEKKEKPDKSTKAPAKSQSVTTAASDAAASDAAAATEAAGGGATASTDTDRQRVLQKRAASLRAAQEDPVAIAKALLNSKAAAERAEKEFATAYALKSAYGADAPVLEMQYKVRSATELQAARVEAEAEAARRDEADATAAQMKADALAVKKAIAKAGSQMSWADWELLRVAAGPISDAIEVGTN